ncbi:MAG: 30S ribosomal protein S9 [bacterium]|jgi:small subunit ribosomal protein S9
MKQSNTMHHGIGRRKSATARVWMKSGTGVISVNGRDYKEYFDTDTARTAVCTPLVLTGLSKNYDVMANVQGGGRTGQSGAIMLGVARALLTIDENLRPTLREQGLLTVDSRVKERKKYGQKAARKKFQFVKR